MSEIFFQELIPEGEYGVYVNDYDSLLNLGKYNLRYIKDYWNLRKRELEKEISLLQTYFNDVKEETIKGIKATACFYECPELPDNMTKETFDKKSILRKKYSTTFNCCGWCSFARNSNVMIYDCNMDAQCGLIVDEFKNGSGFNGENEFRYNTPCVFGSCSQLFLTVCVDDLAAKIDRLKAEANRIKQRAQYITDLLEGPVSPSDKPCFPSWRPFTWFTERDKPVIVYYDDDIFLRCFTTDWPRNGGEDVSVKLDLTNSASSARYLTIGKKQPVIMYSWEYDYLKKNRDYLLVWKKKVLSDDNCEVVEKMLNAL